MYDHQSRIATMRKNVIALLTLLAIAPSFAAERSFPDAPPQTAADDERFRLFAEADRVKAPAPGGILLVGSSIFRLWPDAPGMMAPLPVLNRAFGGSRTAQQLIRFDQVITPYAPRVIVYYCGSNDIKGGQLPDAIFSNFKEFSLRVQQQLPETRIVFVSSTRSPDRVEKWPLVDCYNNLVRDYCARTRYHTFIDINPLIIDSEGKPRLECYKDDKLHFHPATYLEFTAAIKPVLCRIWHEVQ